VHHAPLSSRANFNDRPASIGRIDDDKQSRPEAPAATRAGKMAGGCGEPREPFADNPRVKTPAQLTLGEFKSGCKEHPPGGQRGQRPPLGNASRGEGGAAARPARELARITRKFYYRLSVALHKSHVDVTYRSSFRYGCERALSFGLATGRSRRIGCRSLLSDLRHLSDLLPPYQKGSEIVLAGFHDPDTSDPRPSGLIAPECSIFRVCTANLARVC
jgi:hypothetical protein